MRHWRELSQITISNPRDEFHLVGHAIAGRAQSLPDFTLVLVDLSGIEVAIAEFERLFDDTGAGAPTQMIFWASLANFSSAFLKSSFSKSSSPGVRMPPPNS